MCGRYALYTDPRKLAERFGLEGPVVYRVSYNIAPTQDILCITQDEAGQRVGGLYRWGLVPFWAKEIGSYSTLNARAETVAKKPAFRVPFRQRRCLIPANGYFEWQQQPGKAKQPYFIHSKNDELIAFAGLWDRWKQSNDELLRSASIIVTQANEKMRAIHARMPVILQEKDWSAWLNPGNHDTKSLHGLLDSAPEESLRQVPVSTRVNSPGNDSSENLEPVE